MLLRLSHRGIIPISRLLTCSSRYFCVSSSLLKEISDAAKTSEGPAPSESLVEKMAKINKEIHQVEKDSRYSLNDASLIHRPDLWKGLPDDTIIKLYRKRVVSLAEAAYIQSVYYDTESDQFDADTETDYDNYITEGEYMDDLAEPNEYDEYPTIAQDIVRDFRDQLEFNRKAAFELPALAKLREEYQPVSNKDKPVIYKYTSFLGEKNPAERKVVLKLKITDLQLSEDASHKLKLLAGPRYDYTTDILKMSSDKFLEQAQNASYLSDILKDLIAESNKDPQEFADVPLDTRSVDARLNKKRHKNKKVYEFPKDWERPIDKLDRKLDLQKLVELK
ncbi:hypothetical protein FOA43_002244 [Brettanomyces nanus]|uniref:Small ribosomal subunit protein mS35 mitochondrial conserved domain-containing protein n=1 Tax=Eeniella nana TaxID=13502 RepID=A0A875S0H2_EENNA|nr:uncharacterized protein FOA43_002244 [Brettanomyces nanus]QPG74906.1 hypothetical protein FOA43_002244 [Brettanomyces nanus]